MAFRCRADGLNVSGRTCRHCDLDDAFLAWELRLFRLQARGGGGVGDVSQVVVSADQAIQQAQARALHRVGAH